MILDWFFDMIKYNTGHEIYRCFDLLKQKQDMILDWCFDVIKHSRGHEF